MCNASDSMSPLIWCCAGPLLHHQSRSVLRPGGRPERYCALAGDRLFIFKNSRLKEHPNTVFSLAAIEVQPVEFGKRKFHKGFRLVDSEGNVRALLSTKSAANYAGWVSAFHNVDRLQQEKGTPNGLGDLASRHKAQEAASPRSPRWERPCPRISSELTPSKCLNRASPELFEEERAEDLVAPVMGAPFALLLLLGVLIVERLADSIRAHGWLFSATTWAARLIGTPQMRLAAAVAAVCLALCAAATLGTARLAVGSMKHEGRRFSPAFTEAIAWVLHVVFSIAVPIAAAICVCNASEPAPLFAMGFMGTCITLVLKLSNFAVHQWHCRTLARSPSTTSRPHTLVSIPAFAYFLIAPTLNFALEYPSGLPINPFRLARRAVYLAVMLLAMGFVISQMLEPLWSQMVAVGSAWPPQPLAYAHLFLKLALPVFLVWLGAFIAFFHLWLGMLAESTGFGDRRFFLDWWNAPSMKEFWSRWNLPVHHWALSSVQAPLKRFGKPVTGIIVFLVSAVLHELALSAPLQVTRSWALLGMLAQVPLVILTMVLPRALRRVGATEEVIFLVGNAALWISFCFVGQPLCLILYASAYAHTHAGAQE